jgi:hypothetical protein
LTKKQIIHWGDKMNAEYDYLCCEKCSSQVELRTEKVKGMYKNFFFCGVCDSIVTPTKNYKLNKKPTELPAYIHDAWEYLAKKYVGNDSREG